MNWESTAEDKLLSQAAHSYFREKWPVQHLRRLRDSNDVLGFSRTAWQELAELGWTGMLLAEEYGGLGLGFRHLGLVLEAAGQTLCATPLLSTTAGAGTLLQSLGNRGQRESFLPAIARGEELIAIAHTEGSRHQSPIACTAKAKNDGFVIHGHKSLVLDAMLADHILVLARTDPQSHGQAGLSWFIVPSATKGLTRRTYQLIDGRPAADLEFNDVWVANEALLGALHGAAESYQKLENISATCIAAESFGAAQEAFRMTLSYVKERRQFGVPIGSFQALQHRLATLFADLELCRAVVQRSLAALDEDAGANHSLASLAKAKLSTYFVHLAEECLQLHGGIGMTDEHNIGLFLKRSRINAELMGSADYHRDRYARVQGY